MKTFQVEASFVTYAYLTIEANDENDAYRIAKEADGGDFKQNGFGDWNIENITELKGQ